MRVEVLELDGVERRRRWSREDKARIVEEMLAPGARVSEVARHHGISPSLVFTWRRQLRANQEPAQVVPRFAAVRIADASTEAANSTTSGQPRAGSGGRSGLSDMHLRGGRRLRVDAVIFSNLVKDVAPPRARTVIDFSSETRQSM
jgi:transposase